jgi:hypothetical protein
VWKESEEISREQKGAYGGDLAPNLSYVSDGEIMSRRLSHSAGQEYSGKWSRKVAFGARIMRRGGGGSNCSIRLM